MPTKPSDTIEKAYVLASRNADRSGLYALKADQAGRAGLARLFIASAESRRVQINRARMLLRGRIAKSFEDNLAEHAAATEAALADLVGLIEQAKHEGDGGIAKFLGQMRKVEMIGQTRFNNAAAPDTNDSCTAYHVCQICGYIAEDSVPEECPVCGAIPEKFKQMD